MLNTTGHQGTANANPSETLPHGPGRPAPMLTPYRRAAGLRRGRTVAQPPRGEAGGFSQKDTSLSCLPGNDQAYRHRKTCARRFSAAFPVTAPSWKEPRRWAGRQRTNQRPPICAREAAPEEELVVPAAGGPCAAQEDSLLSNTDSGSSLLGFL